MNNDINDRLSSLPNTLSLNAGMDNSLDLAFWSTQMTLILEQHEGKKPPAPEEEDMSKQTPPPGQKACRYGMSCTRNDCKFWHPNQEHIKEPALDVGDQLAKINKSWVPFEVTLHLTDDGIVHTDEDVKEKLVNNIKESLIKNVKNQVGSRLIVACSLLLSFISIWINVLELSGMRAGKLRSSMIITMELIKTLEKANERHAKKTFSGSSNGSNKQRRKTRH